MLRKAFSISEEAFKKALNLKDDIMILDIEKDNYTNSVIFLAHSKDFSGEYTEGSMAVTTNDLTEILKPKEEAYGV